jgi:hypothetical protein
MIVVRWCIPNISSRLRDQIRQETYITNEIIIQQETLRARGCAFGGDANNGDSDRNPCTEWGHLFGSDLNLFLLARHKEEIRNARQKRLAKETHSSDRPVSV